MGTMLEQQFRDEVLKASTEIDRTDQAIGQLYTLLADVDNLVEQYQTHLASIAQTKTSESNTDAEPAADAPVSNMPITAKNAMLEQWDALVEEYNTLNSDFQRASIERQALLEAFQEQVDAANERANASRDESKLEIKHDTTSAESRSDKKDDMAIHNTLERENDTKPKVVEKLSKFTMSTGFIVAQFAIILVIAIILAIFLKSKFKTRQQKQHATIEHTSQGEQTTAGS